jgi:hypothetical protein
MRQWRQRQSIADHTNLLRGSLFSIKTIGSEVEYQLLREFAATPRDHPSSERSHGEVLLKRRAHVRYRRTGWLGGIYRIRPILWGAILRSRVLYRGSNVRF